MSIEVILDTNILRKDFLRSGTDFKVLLDYVKKTGGRISIPRIVLDEIINLYARELASHVQKLEKSKNTLGRLGADINIESMPNIASVVERYKTNLLKDLRTTDDKIVDYASMEGYLEDLIQRSINKIAPLHNKDSAFRDGVLWLSVVERAKRLMGLADEDLVFISENTKEFGGDEGLNSRLKSELAEKNITNVAYFTSIRNFIAQHVTEVDGFDDQWVEENIDLDYLAEEISSHYDRNSWLEDRLLDTADHSCFDSDLLDYEVSIKHITVSGYFTYKMIDGTYKMYLTVDYFLSVNFSYEHECEDLDPYSERPFTISATEHSTYELDEEAQFAISIEKGAFCGLELLSL